MKYCLSLHAEDGDNIDGSVFPDITDPGKTFATLRIGDRPPFGVMITTQIPATLRRIAQAAAELANKLERTHEELRRINTITAPAVNEANDIAQGKIVDPLPQPDELVAPPL